MTSYEFWNKWKRKTRLELAAVRSIKTARKIILANIPKNQIVAIYAKGSFVRREMNKESDVDTITILKESKYLDTLRALSRKYRHAYHPNLQLAGYSLWELKHNKRAKTKDNKPRASPSRAIQHLEYYQLLYGKPLRKEEYNSGTPKGHLSGMITVFRKTFLPELQKKKMGFSEVAKQVFWLVENEQKVLGKNPPYNWKKLAKSIPEKNHIIHDALRFRQNPTKDKRKRKAFLRKLDRYLSKMEHLID